MSTSTAPPRPRIYTGRSVEELIPRIERELGRDAIVTRRRSGLGGGVAGFFQRPFVEIEAHAGHPSVDLYDDRDATAIAPPAAEAPARPAVPSAAAVLARFAAGQLEEAGERALAVEAPAADGFAAVLARAQVTPSAMPSGLADDVARAPSLGAAVATPAPAGSGRAPAVATPAPAVAAPAAPSTPEPAHLASRPAARACGALAPRRKPAPAAGEQADALRAKLLERGLSDELAEQLLAQAHAHALALGARDGDLAGALAAVLRAHIPNAPIWPATGACVALVGPGGAGKTSFCAALASSYRARSPLPVACATILPAGDAGEHSLLLSPHLLAPTPVEDERVEGALAGARAEGMLLLDAPCTPACDRAEIARLAELLEHLAPEHVVLTLPATYGARAAEQLLRAMRPLRVGCVAITHAHETDQLGAAVQAACAAGLAPAFLLDQRRDGAGLLRTDPRDLAERLLA